MKLYEFTYTDNQNQTEAQILLRVADILEAEADEQAWAPDFRFQQSSKPERLATGELQYHFEVQGQFQENSGDDRGTDKTHVSAESKEVAASPEA